MKAYDSNENWVYYNTEQIVSKPIFKIERIARDNDGQEPWITRVFYTNGSAITLDIDNEVHEELIDLVEKKELTWKENSRPSNELLPSSPSTELTES